MYWLATRKAANSVAASRGLPARKVFDDTLTADVARVQVRRTLMRLFPGLTACQRNDLIVELTEDFDV